MRYNHKSHSQKEKKQTQKTKGYEVSGPITKYNASTNLFVNSTQNTLLQ